MVDVLFIPKTHKDGIDFKKWLDCDGICHSFQNRDKDMKITFTRDIEEIDELIDYLYDILDSSLIEGKIIQT